MKNWIVALLLSLVLPTFAGRVRYGSGVRDLQVCGGELVAFTTSFIFEAVARPSEITEEDTNTLADIMQTAYWLAAGCDSTGAFINIKDVRVTFDVTGTLPENGPATVPIPFLVEFDLECRGCNPLGSIFSAPERRRRTRSNRGQRSHDGKKGGSKKGKGGKRYRGDDDDDDDDDDDQNVEQDGGDDGNGAPPVRDESGLTFTNDLDDLFDARTCNCDLPTLSAFIVTCNSLLPSIGIDSLSSGNQLQTGIRSVDGEGELDLGGVSNSFATFIGVELSCIGCSAADFDTYAAGLAFEYNKLNYLNPAICDPNGRMATASTTRSVTRASRVPTRVNLFNRGNGRRTQFFNGAVTIVIEIMATCQINCQDQTVIFGDHGPPATGRKLAGDAILCPSTGFDFGCPTLEDFADALENYADSLVGARILPPNFQFLSLSEIDQSEVAPVEIPAIPTPTPSDLPSMTPSTFPTLSQSAASELRTCVAIIDETQGSFSNAYFDARWTEFRETFQMRSFCLIRVASVSSVYVPPALLADNNTIVPDLIPFDDGDATLASDFFNLCRLSEIPRSITNVAIFIDTSSLPAARFQASFDLFTERLVEAGLGDNRQLNDFEDYITPFIRDIF